MYLSYIKIKSPNSSMLCLCKRTMPITNHTLTLRTPSHTAHQIKVTHTRTDLFADTKRERNREREINGKQIVCIDDGFICRISHFCLL